MRRHWLALFALPSLLVGCGSSPGSEALATYKSAALSSEEDVKGWATSASAPNIYNAISFGPALAGLGSSGSREDPNCPKLTEEGNTTRLTGDCTDTNGLKWHGSLVSVRDAAGSETGRITYEKFGYETPVECDGKTGTVTLLFQGSMTVGGTAEKKTFDIDVRMDASGLGEASCTEKSASAAWDYTGTIEGSSTLGERQTWNGSGRVGSSEKGVVTVETKDELLDSESCSSEALSGTTTLESGDHSAVITYDGQTDCEDASTVQWSLNGEARGELSGVRCSAASAPALSAWSLLMVGALGLLRRRSQR